MNVLECPYTKNLVHQLEATNDAEEKENIIASIRAQMCGTSTDQTVCCDINNVIVKGAGKLF